VKRVAFVLVFMLAAVAATSQASQAAERRQSVQVCHHVRFSVSEPSGMTGGTILTWVTLKNTGRSVCSVWGHPFVRVPPVSYPVVVQDLVPGGFVGGTGKTQRLAPGASVRAAVMISRGSCSGGRAEVEPLTIRVGWWQRSVAVRGWACVRRGPTILVGSFQRRTPTS
jgi:hypothetical protein